MRHLKAGRRLGRTTEHRLAMLRNLVTALFGMLIKLCNNNKRNYLIKVTVKRSPLRNLI